VQNQNERFVADKGVFLRDQWVGMDVVEYGDVTTEIKTICRICDDAKRYNKMEFAEHLLKHVNAKEIPY
jgi:hypothetical protein